MANPFVEHLKAELKKRPDECYVTDTFVAVLVGEEESVLCITGDFKGKTPAEVNDKIVEAINKLGKI